MRVPTLLYVLFIALWLDIWIVIRYCGIMSRGKYSPFNPKVGPYDRNCYGQIPPDYPLDAPPPDIWENYDVKIYFADFNAQGYDSYGYSSFDLIGWFVGFGQGVDANGKTEMDYLRMNETDYYNMHG